MEFIVSRVHVCMLVEATEIEIDFVIDHQFIQVNITTKNAEHIKSNNEFSKRSYLFPPFTSIFSLSTTSAIKQQNLASAVKELTTPSINLSSS